MYYKHPTLFGKQSTVDTCVDVLARTFDTSRASLNVGMLVPEMGCEDVLDTSKLKWVLVIEKEAVFRTLTSSDLWHTISEEGLLITGRGYPDVATRLLLNRVHSHLSFDEASAIPFHALVDFDPDGLLIFTTYRDGSKKFSHNSQNMTIPDLCWTGIKSDNVMAATSLHYNQCLPALSIRDRRKALNKLEACYMQTNEVETELAKELRTMLMLNVKAEIEHLDIEFGGVVGWVQKSVIATSSGTGRSPTQASDRDCRSHILT
ncbi:MAG: hypothetical protein M1828_005013 [Chrysothrix sp. TS-e1954]|nr:MAG: hypothetical protein M1828_005013 [Chrysothrix sp. TS-e1954]